MGTAVRATAPPSPLHPADRDIQAGWRWSLAVHAVLLAWIIVRSIVAPSHLVTYVPTLRVDLVALPDVLKKDKEIVAPSPANPDEVEKKLKQAEVDAKRIKTIETPPKAPDVAKPDEMVLHPTAAPDKKALQKKMKSALERIKALNKINDDVADQPKVQVIKGNKVSKGFSISDDAKEAGEANYLDALRQHLQDSWALPVWLARQKLDAQVQIFIDADGKLLSFRFIKASGNAQFDNEVKKTLNSSQPFPKPPAEALAGVLSHGVLVGFPL